MSRKQSKRAAAEVLAAAGREANIDEAVPSSYEPDAPGASPADRPEGHGQHPTRPFHRPKKSRVPKPKPQKPPRRPAAAANGHAGNGHAGKPQAKGAARGHTYPPRGEARPRPETNGHAGNGHADNDVSAEDKKLTLVSVADIADEDITDLWERRISRGELSLIVGETGAGKGFLSTELAACVSTGNSLPGGPINEAGEVLYFVSEDNMAAVVKKRLIAAGANLSRVRTLSPKDAENMPLHGVIGHLEAGSIFQQDRPPLLVILDCVSDFMPPNSKPSLEECVRPFLQRLKRIARKWGFALVLVRHPRKDEQALGVNGVAGAGAWTQLPRHILVIEERSGEDFDRRVRCIKQSNGPRPPVLECRIETKRPAARIVWGRELDTDGQDAEDDPATRLGRSKLDFAITFLNRELSTGAKWSKYVRQRALDACITPDTFDRAHQKVCGKPFAKHVDTGEEKKVLRWFLWLKSKGKDMADE